MEGTMKQRLNNVGEGNWEIRSSDSYTGTWAGVNQNPCRLYL